MALVDVAAAKRYLRLQTSADDLLLEGLVASALSLVEAWIGRPVLLDEYTIEDEGRTSSGVRSVCALLVPVTPIGEVVSIHDADGEALTLADLRINATTGVITAKDGSAFANGPYTLVVEIGLAARPDYEARVEPVINQALLDIVADLYQRRNPAAGREAEGGGIAVDYVRQTRGVGADNSREDMLPERTAAILAPFRLVQV